jgi:hypothetical protein
MPIQPQVQPVTQIEQTPTLVQPVSTPVDPIEQVEEIVPEEIVPEEEISQIDIEDEIAEEITDELVAELEEEVVDEVVTELEEEPKTALLKPIRAKLSAVETFEEKTASITAIKPLLQPVKKMRGSPPKSGKGESPSSESKKPITKLTPIKTMTPLKIERKKMQPSKEEEN